MESLFKKENDSDFKCETEDIVINCYNSDCAYPAREELKTLLLKTKCNTEKLQQILSDKGFEKERVLYFVNLIESKKCELLYLSLIDYNSKFGEAVSDFDWVLKLVNGTSELKSHKYSVLQLTVTTTKNSVQSQRMFEISKDMLNRFINTIKTVQ